MPERQTDDRRPRPPRGTRAECEVRLCYGDHGTARRMADSLSPDDDADMSTLLDGDAVVARASSSSVMSLMRALDDLLACAATAERSLAVAKAAGGTDGGDGDGDDADRPAVRPRKHGKSA